MPPPAGPGVGTNRLWYPAAGVPCTGTGIKVGRVLRFSIPCPGSAEQVGRAGGNASDRGPHEKPINDDDAELVESKAAEDKDERRTLFNAFPFPGPFPGLGRMSDNPGETDEDGWKKAENGNPCESDSSYCVGGLLPVAPVLGATLGSVYVN